ncbi:hypothetical protein J2X97_000354 [Epilithonimonas hungarica]|uniref:hypothetical protein n=1 Tax=Epilithonimonas hungarica TaxID=454006 RepID=UPI002784E6A2|nr:hypothetical protein [Epilithonimonas hungarica]MDP9954717.1 hypothetical protein [Epilithonimonas hungarica]
MKTLTLKLKKDILIVDIDKPENVNSWIKIYSEYGTFLCKGTPTEEQAAELVDTDVDVWPVDWFKDYTVIDTELHDAFIFLTAVESFLSAVSAQGYHWLVNPESTELTFLGNPSDIDVSIALDKQKRRWEFAESRTFKNPIIFIK